VESFIYWVNIFARKELLFQPTKNPVHPLANVSFPASLPLEICL